MCCAHAVARMRARIEPYRTLNRRRYAPPPPSHTASNMPLIDATVGVEGNGAVGVEGNVACCYSCNIIMHPQCAGRTGTDNYVNDEWFCGDCYEDYSQTQE